MIIEALDENFEEEWKESLEADEKQDIVQDEIQKICDVTDEEEQQLDDFVEADNISDDLTLGSPAHSSQNNVNKVQNKKVILLDLKQERVKKAKIQGKIQEVTEEHEESIRKFASLQCEKCQKQLSGWYDSREHYKSKHQEKGFVRCCGRKIERAGEIIEHINWHRDPNIFTCKVCGKASLTREHLNIHEAVHIPQDERQFPCLSCDKKFGNAFYLLCHKRTHRIENMKPTIPCTACEKLFKTQSQLKLHISSVHNTSGLFMCEFCSKVLKSKYTLEIHIKSHTKPEPSIQCNLCGHYIKNKRRFAVHMSRHKEEENGPYPCEECKSEGVDKKFKKIHLLRNHMASVHTTKKFKCEECGKEFKRKMNLYEHSAQHTGIALYQCPFCPRTFKSNANMHSHKKKMHPEEYSTLPLPDYLRPPEIVAENDE